MKIFELSDKSFDKDMQEMNDKFLKAINNLFNNDKRSIVDNLELIQDEEKEDKDERE